MTESESRRPAAREQVESPMNKRPSLLDQVAVQKLHHNGRWYVLPVDQIAYIFLGSASALRSIHAPWSREAHLETGDVYVRTLRGVTARTDFRQFTEIEVRLDQRQFILVNRALMVNLRRITELDLKGKIKQIGIAAGDETEWLSVSRRPLELLLQRLGFRKRRVVPVANGPGPLSRPGRNS
jgi:hypothetical protein